MSGGLTRERSDYFDDSSAALKLTRRSKVPPADVFDRGGDKLPGPGKLREREIAEREKIIAGEQQQRERDIRKLIDRHEMTRKQAEELLAKEAALHHGKPVRLSAAERQARESENLMDAHKKPAKHSSSSKGRKRQAKRGTWICKQCNLEFCEHRQARSKRAGRPKSSPRTLDTHARLSPETKATLGEEKLGTSDALEVTAIAIRSGQTFAAVLADFRSRKGVGASPAA